MSQPADLVPEGPAPQPAAVLHVATPADSPRAGGTYRGPRDHRVPLLLLLSGPVVLLLVTLDAPAPLRAAPVLIYLALVPGLAAVRLLRLAEPLLETVLGIGLSLALGVLVAQVMIYVGVWSATLGIAVLVCVGQAASAVELYIGPLRRRGRRS
ncbi:MAG TPA: hypothetical protein VK659_28955 [Asanoa sp.]|nr:hypothetical protein [Asanoa sp.]